MTDSEAKLLIPQLLKDADEGILIAKAFWLPALRWAWEKLKNGV